MAYILIRAIRWFANVLFLLLLGRALLSWFARDPYSTAGKLYQLAVRLTEPIVEPCRRLLSGFNTGMLDFSVFLALILVELAETILIKIVQILFFI